MKVYREQHKMLSAIIKTSFRLTARLEPEALTMNPQGTAVREGLGGQIARCPDWLRVPGELGIKDGCRPQYLPFWIRTTAIRVADVQLKGRLAARPEARPHGSQARIAPWCRRPTWPATSPGGYVYTVAHGCLAPHNSDSRCTFVRVARQRCVET